MRTLIKKILLAVTLFLLAACQQAAEPAATVDLAGTNWILSSLNGELPLAGTTVTLQFGNDGTVSGTDGCNRFNTTYTQDGSSLTINPSTGISTLMACEEPVMNQATAYTTALSETSSFTASGNQLSLSNGNEVLATFVAGTVDTAEPVNNADLSGTNWLLSALNGELPISGTTMYLQFATDGTVSGSDGCNLFNASFTQEGTVLTINMQEGATTDMACEEPVMAQATVFTTALADTTNFVMTENDLVLQNGDEVLATFVVNSTDLANTVWEVVNYNNGREAVVGLISGTEITAYFGLEGDLSGNAGCNQYFTSFTAGNGSIEIGTIGSSMRFCEEPLGVMEQEAEYLAALESATTYSIQGDVLQMRTAGDELAVVMKRKLIVDLPEPAPAVPTGRVTGAPLGANVRSGPGINFPIIGLAQNGDEGEIVGRSADNRWWATPVPSAPGGIGWVSADLVIATNAENVPVIEVAPPVIVVPTAAATPTPVPSPTATPTAEISFTADRTTIAQGECATLSWTVQNVQAVWVYPLGQPFNQFPRTGQGSERVCPTSTTTYELRALQRDGTTQFRQITITVVGTSATATPVPAPTATATSAPASDPLAGTRWEVVNYNDGSALVSVINDTRITMEFGQDGRVTGNSGCNNYSAAYQVNSSNITIGSPGGTQRFCEEPEGIMEQETEFLAALQLASDFTINGSRLEIRTPGGQNAIIATQMP
jgi:heat shock protein HslJ